MHSMKHILLSVLLAAILCAGAKGQTVVDATTDPTANPMI